MPTNNNTDDQRKIIRPDDTGLTLMFTVIRQMASDLSKVTTDVANVSSAFTSHMVTEEEQRQEVTNSIQALADKIDEALKLKEAFPEVEGKPDIHGHRVDHETRIESNARTNKLLDKIKEEFLTNAVRGVMLALVIIFGLGIRDWAVSTLTNLTGAVKPVASVGVKQ